jgi:uncharacterized membrane protein YphA (DoxX/SURF4 family)
VSQAPSNAAASDAHRASPPWRTVVGTVAGVVLGLVLLAAAWAKLLDPGAFAEQISYEGLDFLLPAHVVAYIALALEIVLGTALVLGIRHRAVLLPAALLVAFFLFLNVRAVWLDSQGLRDEAASCGCFGNLVERTPSEALWMDLGLLLPPLLLAFLGRRDGPFPWRRGVVAALVTVAGLVFASLAPGLPLDDLATRLKPGVEVENLCTGTGADRFCLTTALPELAAGRHLVVLADLEDDAFGESVEGLNEYVFAGQGPALWVASAATSEQHHTFYWSWGPAFELREVPPALLRPLYRRLPRSFLVEDGTVVETYDGLPPQIEPEGAGDTSSGPADIE